MDLYIVPLFVGDDAPIGVAADVNPFLLEDGDYPVWRTQVDVEPLVDAYVFQRACDRRLATFATDPAYVNVEAA